MDIGIQLPNHTRRLNDLEIARLQALKPKTIRAYTNTPNEQLQQVVDAVGLVKVILRSHRNDAVNPEEWAQDFWYAVNRMRGMGFAVWLAPSNEPNHPEGPYNGGRDIERFKRDYGKLVGELGRIFPGVPLVSPNLAVAHLDLEWANGCRDLFDFHQYIGTNAYWQYDNHLDPNWGLRVTQFVRIFPDKQFVVLEVGDSTPDRSSRERCLRIADNMKGLASLGYVTDAIIFILGFDEQAPQTWPEFVYDPADLKIITEVGMDKVKIGNMEVEDWRRELVSDYPSRQLSEIHFLIIHHSATAADVSPQAIHSYHKSLDWPGIGYNFLVYPDKVCYVGDLLSVRAHTYGWNRQGVGICLVGNFTDTPPPESQIVLARELVANLQYALGWFIPVTAHKDMPMNRTTECPGNTWEQWRPRILLG